MLENYFINNFARFGADDIEDASIDDEVRRTSQTVRDYRQPWLVERNIKVKSEQVKTSTQQIMR